MAELPTPTQKTVPSDDIRDHIYAGGMLDKVVTSTDLTYTDRLGGEHYTVDGIKAEGDKVVEETRQNLIPLSKQYMTLADAQADTANIPDGSTTYVRSTDGSSLANEYINNGGTLEATGRKMPSQQSIDKYFQVLPDGTFALMADNGVVFAIDKDAVARAVSLIVQDLISIGGASLQLYPQARGFYILGDNGMALALGTDGILRTAAANVAGSDLNSDTLGVPFLIRGINGIAGAIDINGNLRIPGVITDKLMVDGKEITGNGGGGDSTFSSGDRYIDENGDVMPIFPDSTKMSAWGSSSLVQYNADLNFSAMVNEIGILNWRNEGKGGESSFQTAARFGGVPFTLIFPNDIIPASGSVDVTCTQLPSNFRNNYLKTFSGTASGVAGTLSWASTTLRFTRATAGDAVSVSGGVDFIPTLPDSYRDGVVLLWMYKNDLIFDEDANPEINMDIIFDNVVKTFKHVSTFNKRCVVIGVFANSSYTVVVQKTRLYEMNARMRGYFGDLYCDVQDYMCSSQIWIDSGITPTSADLTMQANGLKATSLSADSQHLNETAHKAIVENVIKTKLISLGWY